MMQQQHASAATQSVNYDNQVWTEYQDDLGRVYVDSYALACAVTGRLTICRYYHNVLTNATQWDRPPPASQRW